MSINTSANRVPPGSRTAASILMVAAALLFASMARAEPDLADTGALEQLMTQGVPVVDVRTRSEWEKTGIIEGAHLLTFFDDAGKYDWNAWFARFQEIAGPDQPVVLMCHSGVRSALISKALTDQTGYTKVYDYGPGIAGWLKGKRPTVPPGEASQ